MTVTQNDQERLQALESELSNTKAELARVAREQALAVESLRASEELKSRLIACSRDCIKILDLEGNLLFMNEGGMQVLEICDISPFLNSCWVLNHLAHHRGQLTVYLRLNEASRHPYGRQQETLKTRAPRLASEADVCVRTWPSRMPT